MTKKILVPESNLLPGDIFVTPTYGSWYDRVVGAGIRYFTATKNEYGKWENAKVNHTGIYLGNGQIIEAAPGGARLADWDSYGNDAIWATRGLKGIRLDDDARARIVHESFKLVGTPYGFLDIAAIACAQARLGHVIDPTKPLDEQPWWVRKIEDRHTLICSQLVDTTYRNAGLHLFQDKRIPGLVSPNNIYSLFA